MIAILQSPGEWVLPAQGGAAASAARAESESDKTDKKEEGETSSSESNEPKGDPEMAPVYLRHLLPVFTQVYQGSMQISIKKASLALIRKMIHYVPVTLLEELCQADSQKSLQFAVQLVEVLALVLDSEVKTENHSRNIFTLVH